jgi:hypothetical protein
VIEGAAGRRNPLLGTNNQLPVAGGVCSPASPHGDQRPTTPSSCQVVSAIDPPPAQARLPEKAPRGAGAPPGGTPMDPKPIPGPVARRAPPAPRGRLAVGRGALLNSLGCSLVVGPPRVRKCHCAIKCHQKSTSNSAGSSVGSLAPPRASTPRLGGVCVSCQYFACSFVLALRELGLRLGVKAPLPLRASSRGVLPGPGALEYGNRRLSTSWLIRPRGSKSRPETMYCLAALRRVGKTSPVADEVTGGWRMGLFQTSSKTKSHRCVPLAYFTASEITNHPVSFATATFSPPPAERRRTTRWAYSRHLGMTCDHRYVPPLFRTAVPGDLNSRVSQIRSWQGALSHHAFMIRSR